MLSNESQAVDVAGLISRSTWFHSLPEAALARLVSAAQIRHYDKNDFLFRSGETTSYVYGVASGRVRLGVTTELGHEFALTDVETGFWIGEQVLCNDEVRALDAHALEDSTIIEIHKSSVLDVARSYPDMYRLLFEEHVLRTRRLFAALPLVFYPLKARLAGRLLSLIPERGRRTDGGILLAVQLSQNDYARLALGSRQRINKIFREWSERGIVISQEEGYLITDIGGLRKEAELTEE